MRPNAGLRSWWILMLPIMMAGVAAAQDNTSSDHTSSDHTSSDHTSSDHTSSDHTSPNVIVSQSPSKKGMLPCKAGTNFETDNYRIANITIDDPFRFLYWIGGKSRDIEAQLRAKLNGQLFT